MAGHTNILWESPVARFILAYGYPQKEKAIHVESSRFLFVFVYIFNRRERVETNFLFLLGDDLRSHLNFFFIIYS